MFPQLRKIDRLARVQITLEKAMYIDRATVVRKGIYLTAVALFICLLFQDVVNAGNSIKQMAEPILFEANYGQIHKEIRYRAFGKGYQVEMRDNATTLKLHTPKGERHLTLQMLGAHSAKVEATGGQVAYFNYFRGNLSVTGVPVYQRVAYRQIYRGVDLVYYGNLDSLEYDFRLASGVDPSVIAMQFRGAETLSVSERGELVLAVGGIKVLQPPPYAYQETSRGRHQVECSYVVNDGTVSFKLGEYNKALPLVIDPVLNYATYLGGNRSDVGNNLLLDANGNLYVVGVTNSTDFPTRNSIQDPDNAIGDIFVSRLDATGRLIYSTYIGGSSVDSAQGAALGSDGALYLTGLTQSLDFPVRPSNAFQSTYNSRTDAFVIKLSADGRSLVYSTFLGGTGDDQAVEIAADSAGNAYVVGTTNSTDFPVTEGAFQRAFQGFRDIFVTKLNPAGTAAVYSTYLGDFGNDTATAMALDSAGRVYVAGTSTSDNYPTLRAFQATRGGSGSPIADGVVTVLSASGNSLVYSTYFGGSEEERVGDIILDAAGSFYIVGATRSTDLPIANAFQSSSKGGSIGNGFFLGPFDAFVAKFVPDGSRLAFSTYLGGSEYDEATGIALDPAGNIYICGATSSDDFPLSRQLQNFNASQGEQRADIFVAKFDPAAKTLLYSTYYGGSRNDAAVRIATDRSGSAYVVGFSTSGDFPTVKALQSSFGGSEAGVLSGDAIVLRIDNTASYTLTSDVASLTLRRKQTGQLKFTITRDPDFLNVVKITAPDLSKQKIVITPDSGTIGTDGLIFRIKPKRKAELGTFDLIFTGADANGLKKSVTVKLLVTE